jgi:CDP-4-dehydro-6-deoxyglucose reductase
MALIPWRTATVIGIENETPDTRRFRLLMDGLDHFEFEPGQFITLDLPIHEKPNKRWRSYSIASFPDGSNEIELLIVLNPEGLGTNYLFNEIQIGSQLTYRGPQGVFVLPKVLDKTLFLICTGTGIAPFRSMVQNILRKKIPHQGINLIYGCRKKNNLMYFDELRQLEQEMQGFRYYPTLSREVWEGKTGYVHDIYETLCQNQTPANFFLCGWKAMIDDAKGRIKELGYDKKDIHVELYG